MFGILHTVFCFLLPMACSSRSLTTDIKFANCGPEGSITSVALSPCTSQPCVFHHGTNVTVTIKFKADMDAGDLKTKVYGEVLGQWIPFPLPNPNACSGCHLVCPLSKGGDYVYENIFAVIKSYPNIKLAVKWEILNADDQPLVCFVFPMQIND